MADVETKKGTTADFYYLLLDNTNRVSLRGLVRAPFTRDTIGAHTAGDLDNELLWDPEAAMQLGSQSRQDVVAGMATAGLGYHLRDRARSPTIWAYYDYASGDDTPNSGNQTTFNQLFPFGHYYMGWADFVARQNIHDVNFHLNLYPTKWATVWFQSHNIRLANRRDAIYNPAGNATRRDPTGAAGSRVGHEVDAVANFHLTTRSDLLAGVFAPVRE